MRVSSLRGIFAWGRIYWRYRVMSRATHRLANARDVADAAPRLARSVVYRSDAPLAGDLEPRGISRWPPATVVDLRGEGEKAREHPLAGIARVIGIDVLDAAAFTGDAPSASLGSLGALYALMTSRGSAPGLTRVVTEVARGETPVLIHCSAGKDRTGLSVALILRLLGVERERVVADYVLTQRHMPLVLARMLAGRRGTIGGASLGSVPREVLTAPAQAIETVLDAWDAHEGGVEGWYLAHGGDPRSLAALRARLRA